MIFIFLYCREKAHDNKNSVVKIQNLDMSQESEAIKSNPGALKTSRNEKSCFGEIGIPEINVQLSKNFYSLVAHYI